MIIAYNLIKTSVKLIVKLIEFNNYKIFTNICQIFL